MALSQRIAPGVYITPDGYRVERVTDPTTKTGFGTGWHLLRGYGLDAYYGTYATKADALANIPRDQLGIR